MRGESTTENVRFDLNGEWLDEIIALFDKREGITIIIRKEHARHGFGYEIFEIHFAGYRTLPRAIDGNNEKLVAGSGKTCQHRRERPRGVALREQALLWCVLGSRAIHLQRPCSNMAIEVIIKPVKHLVLAGCVFWNEAEGVAFLRSRRKHFPGARPLEHAFAGVVEESGCTARIALLTAMKCFRYESFSGEAGVPKE